MVNLEVGGGEILAAPPVTRDSRKSWQKSSEKHGIL